MNIKEVRFKITGLSPILTHNPASMTRSGSGDIKRPKIPTPEEEAERGLYLTAKGDYYLPTVAFRSALLYAVGGKKVGRRPARMIVAAGVFIDDQHDQFILTDGGGKPLKTYEIDTRRAIVQRNGVLRSRPKFSNWGGILHLLIDTDLLDAKIVEENLNEAGTISGVGDYRPMKSGWFGRYTAKLL